MSRFMNSQTPAYKAALACLTVAKGVDVQRLVADVTHGQLRDSFIKLYGLKERKGHACTHRLKGSRQCRCYTREGYKPLDIPHGDHLSEWVRGGRTVAILSQPYGIHHKALVETMEFCKAHDLSVDIGSYPSFHYPGVVISLLFTRVNEPLEPCR